MKHQPKEKWIEIEGWHAADSLEFKPTESLAVDPNNPNVDVLPGTPGLDDLAGLPAVQCDVDGRDFLVWQRGPSPDVDTGSFELM
jgi:hypothetical protein